MQNEILDYDEKKVTELVLKIDDVLHFFKEELNNGITEDSRKLCLKNMLSYVKETMIELGGRADLSDYEDILRNTIQERNQEISLLKKNFLKESKLDNSNIGIVLENNKKVIEEKLKNIGFTCLDINFKVDYKQNVKFECRAFFDLEDIFEQYDIIDLSKNNPHIADTDKNKNLLKSLLSLHFDNSYVKEIKTSSYDGKNYFIREFELSITINNLKIGE